LQDNIFGNTENVKINNLFYCHKYRYLEYTLDASMIRKQDATSIIVDIAGNPDGQTLAWDFVRKNWAYMFTE